MTPVFQTRLYDPANQSPPGNCFQACVASLLECEIDDVPDEADHWSPGCPHSKSWPLFWRDFIPWLRSRGFGYIECTISADAQVYLDDIPLIATGPSPRDQSIHHAVIGSLNQDGFELIHDPHPSQDGIAGDPTSYSFLVPMCDLGWLSEELRD